MKIARVIGGAVLSLTLGCAISLQAQQDERKTLLNRRLKPEQEHPGQWQSLGNLGIGLIPSDRYRAHFGQAHKFHLSAAVYGQDRHFQYGGYSFGFIDEWPTNWLPTEGVFVVQIDGGYYLCNSKYPGATVPLSVAVSSGDREARIAPPGSRTSKASRAKAGSSTVTAGTG
jgi:hypothetical protein